MVLNFDHFTIGLVYIELTKVEEKIQNLSFLLRLLDFQTVRNLNLDLLSSILFNFLFFQDSNLFSLRILICPSANYMTKI